MIWNGHCIHSTARSNARGVFNKKLDYTIHRQLCDENWNFVKNRLLLHIFQIVINPHL